VPTSKHRGTDERPQRRSLDYLPLTLILAEKYGDFAYGEEKEKEAK
jgi:hypothetical protein